MRSFPAKQTVLVPIMGGDISNEAVAVATTLLARPDTQLVLLHVNPAPSDAGDAETARIAAEQQEPRWHHLASSAAPNRTFVDAVVGDPTEEILAQAERFHSDVIVLGPTPTHARPNEWVDRAIAELLLASPRTVRVASRGEPARPEPLTRVKTRRASHQRRSHAAQPRGRFVAPAGHQR